MANSAYQSLNFTFGPVASVKSYNPIDTPKVPVKGYDRNYGWRATNLVPYKLTDLSQLDDMIYISKNVNPQNGTDPYLWNHKVEWSTDLVPTVGSTLTIWLGYNGWDSSVDSYASFQQ
jgi:hypothetical protein